MQYEWDALARLPSEAEAVYKATQFLLSLPSWNSWNSEQLSVITLHYKGIFTPSIPTRISCGKIRLQLKNCPGTARWSLIFDFDCKSGVISLKPNPESNTFARSQFRLCAYSLLQTAVLLLWFPSFCCRRCLRQAPRDALARWKWHYLSVRWGAV